MNLARKHLLGIKPYIAGKPIEETKRQLGLKKVIKLASNENPLGASYKAQAAIRKNLSQINRYPDSNCFYLKNKLAANFNISQSNILLGNGSDEIIDIIIKTFVEDDENIITANATFLEYEIIAKVNKRVVITAALKDFKYDLGAITQKINAKTKVVFIANPNNPTGTYVGKAELDKFIDNLPDNVLAVIDEAYEAFIDVADFPKSLSYIPKKNVIILKTFSKGYGLAGLRVGYAIAKKELIAPMEKVRQPFNVNLLGQAAAIACLDDKEFLQKTKKIILAGKSYLYKELKKLDLVFVPTAANFILIDVRRDSLEIFKKMLKYGVIIRDMRQYGLKNYIRVTIGTERDNKRFIKILKKVLNC